MTTLFISDLHLDATRPRITELFLDFLAGEAREARALYILGDLFEAWVGDDDDDPHHAHVIAGMRSLADAGIPVYVMHGNRDFLLGEEFARRSGCTLLPDPTRISLHGEDVLLMHGDTLCTDDTEYQAIRRQLRSAEWQREFLARPLEQRRAFAQQARAESRAAQQNKSMALMDVNPGEVRRTMAGQDVRLLIHGHTHRPAVHEFDLDGKPARRIVLGDWYEQGSVLRCTGGRCDLAALPVEPA